VSQNFTQLFSTLFPGGTGQAAAHRPRRPAQHRHRGRGQAERQEREEAVAALGRRALLTALAFLFAVFRSRPSPFYVMDEVEAALDDVNLHRFLGLVAEFRKDAQLIVSHQKRTMEAGDSCSASACNPVAAPRSSPRRRSAERRLGARLPCARTI
jgi:chromosome segregation protein